jgi:hypothetical protein
LDPFLGKCCDLRGQIVTHQEDLVTTIRIGRVNGGFRRGKAENRPSVSGIDGGEAEHIAEEGAIRIGISATEDYVSTNDHFSILRFSRASGVFILRWQKNGFRHNVPAVLLARSERVAISLWGS